MKKYFIPLLISFALCLPSYAFTGSAKAVSRLLAPLVTHFRSLPEDEIVRLSGLASRNGGTRAIGKSLGKMNLPDEVLEDTYLRIAIYRSKLTRQEAEGMMVRLRGTPGFRSTLSKIVGNSELVSTGHLYELRIADEAAEHGFKIKGIGVPFKDVNKTAVTDIDVLLERNGKTVAIEAKDYLPNSPIPMDKFRIDMRTLTEYANQNRNSPNILVFSLNNKPEAEGPLKLLIKEAEKRDIELLIGSPEEQVIQIEQLTIIQ